MNYRYEFRQCGSAGWEILDFDGTVFAWTIDPAWAAVIVTMLNWLEDTR